MPVIHLNQKEIEEALHGYAQDMGLDIEGRNITVAFTSGRKENGLTAELTIEEDPDYRAPARFHLRSLTDLVNLVNAQLKEDGPEAEQAPVPATAQESEAEPEPADVSAEPEPEVLPDTEVEKPKAAALFD